MAKMPYTADALPLLARHTAAVLAARLGLSRRCLVLDLDNTLWGGVIGDDGLAGIILGGGTAGEAYVGLPGRAQGARRPRHRARRLLEERPRGGARAVPRPSRDGAEGGRHRRLRRQLGARSPTASAGSPRPSTSASTASPSSTTTPTSAPRCAAPCPRSTSRSCRTSRPAFAARSRSTRISSRRPSPAPTASAGGSTGRGRRRSSCATPPARSTSTRRASGCGADFGAIDRVNLARVVQLINKTNQFNLTTRRRNQAELEAFLASRGAMASGCASPTASPTTG